MDDNLMQPAPDTVLAESLRRTKGWLVFVGVMTIIGAGLGILGSLVGLVGMLAGAAAASSFADQSWAPPGLGADYLTVVAVMFVFGIVCGAVALWAAIMLLQASS
ncbi:MAG: hypothetical protein ABIK43_06540, partial [candidate division WOR-3 bacterium]